MAIVSMTGFGKVEGMLEGRPLSVELRAVNGRFLELSVKLPRELSQFEGAVRSLLQGRLSRGSVQCVVLWGGAGERGAVATGVDRNVAAQYLKMGNELWSELAGRRLPLREQELTLYELMQLPGVLTTGEESSDGEERWRVLLPLIEAALERLLEHRRAEGGNLERDLRNRLLRLDALLDGVERELPARLAQAKLRLEQRVAELLGEQELDPQRMHQELALLVDKIDITEEVVRFRSHNALFEASLSAEGAQGRRLGFLLQEMGREANTLGTKSQHAELQHLAIALKEELEMMREQALNLE